MCRMESACGSQHWICHHFQFRVIYPVKLHQMAPIWCPSTSYSSKEDRSLHLCWDPVCRRWWWTWQECRNQFSHDCQYRDCAFDMESIVLCIYVFTPPLLHDKRVILWLWTFPDKEFSKAWKWWWQTEKEFHPPTHGLGYQVPICLWVTEIAVIILHLLTLPVWSQILAAFRTHLPGPLPTRTHLALSHFPPRAAPSQTQSCSVTWSYPFTLMEKKGERREKIEEEIVATKNLKLSTSHTANTLYSV